MNNFTNKIFIINLLFMFCTSCSNYKYWDIEHFIMDETALHDGENIKLLYTSRGPVSSGKPTFFVHLIAISQETGDTVNILTPHDNALGSKDIDKDFKYYTFDNEMAKISLLDFDQLQRELNLEQIKNSKLPDIKKVVRDPQFDYIADNLYPTVIGIIAASIPND